MSRTLLFGQPVSQMLIVEHAHQLLNEEIPCPSTHLPTNVLVPRHPGECDLAYGRIPASDDVFVFSHIGMHIQLAPLIHVGRSVEPVQDVAHARVRQCTGSIAISLALVEMACIVVHHGRQIGVEMLETPEEEVFLQARRCDHELKCICNIPARRDLKYGKTAKMEVNI